MTHTDEATNNVNGQSRDLDKPRLLKAVELILADPADIKREAQKLSDKYKTKYGSKKSEEEIREMVAKKIISNYSYYAAFTGGATALTGVVPGLGTVVATFGGAAADTALTMKYQIEMVMALAVAYGHDIEKEEEQRICLVVAGLELPPIGWQLFILGSSQSDSTAFPSFLDTYATCLLAEPLRRSSGSSPILVFFRISYRTSFRRPWGILLSNSYTFLGVRGRDIEHLHVGVH